MKVNISEAITRELQRLGKADRLSTYRLVKNGNVLLSTNEGVEVYVEKCDLSAKHVLEMASITASNNGLKGARPSNSVIELVKDVADYSDLIFTTLIICVGDSVEYKAIVEDEIIELDEIILLTVQSMSTEESFNAFADEYVQERLERRRTNLWNYVAALTLNKYPEPNPLTDYEVVLKFVKDYDQMIGQTSELVAFLKLYKVQA